MKKIYRLFIFNKFVAMVMLLMQNHYVFVKGFPTIQRFLFDFVFDAVLIIFEINRTEESTF